MISVERYKAFHGDMAIKAVTGAEYIIRDKDWLYKPEYECWYGDGRSFPASICTPREYEYKLITSVE